jgi:hypothetical protein
MVERWRVGQALFARLRDQGRWLVVLNNAASEEAVRPWVPAGPGHVIVTSRNPHWSEVAAKVQVGVFARGEALGDLPLAMAQGAGLIAETGMPASEYLQLLRDSAAEVLSEGRPGSYPVPLAAAVRVSLDRLTTEDHQEHCDRAAQRSAAADVHDLLHKCSPWASPDRVAARCGWYGHNRVPGDAGINLVVIARIRTTVPRPGLLPGWPQWRARVGVCAVDRMRSTYVSRRCSTCNTVIVFAVLSIS